MTKNVASIFLFSLLFAWVADAQVRKPKRAVKPTDRPASVPPAAFPGYEFIVAIAADKSFTIRVVTGYESPQIDQTSLNKALDEYLSMQSPKLGQIPVGARVMVHTAASLDLKTIIQFLKAARSGASELSLEAAEGVTLKIPAEAKPIGEIDVKPNPLILVAVFDEKGAITLNNEPQGRLSDPSKIGLRLKDIFKAREDNGVFRENTNEIEKTVFIRAPLSARFADLTTFAKELRNVGADVLWLQIDEPEVPELRIELIDLNITPKLVPNPKRRPKE